MKAVRPIALAFALVAAVSSAGETLRYLAEITVKKHLSAIFESLGVSNRAEAVALALRKQMIKS